MYISDSFFVIGGYPESPKFSNIIARFNQNKEWAKVGELVQSRRAHNAIFDGENIIVVGGGTGVSLQGTGGRAITEICSFEGNQISCTTQEPELVDFYGFPELYFVEEDFCKST